MEIQINQSLRSKVRELCENISGSRRITAISFYGAWICNYGDKKTDLNVLMILDYPLRINHFFEKLNNHNISILVINQSDFEKDIKKGWFGEFFSEKITFPYEPLMNKSYLYLREVEVKKRIVLELLNNLILEFPESFQELLIEREFFMYEVMMRKARLFSPSIFNFLNMFQEKIAEKNKTMIMAGFLKAIEELEKENIIYNLGDYIKINQKQKHSIRKRKSKLPSIKWIQRLTLPPLISLFFESTSSIIHDQRLFMKNNYMTNFNGLISRMKDPRKYLFFPTPYGTVPLSDKYNIEDIIKKIIPITVSSKFHIKNIGGVLNDVYLLTIGKNDDKQQFVVKRFLDWSNLKWLSLRLWTIGTTSFSILGHSRLEKEYAINNFLYNKGFPVPKIHYINHKNRLIIEDFIEGENLVNNIKRILSSKIIKTDINLIKKVGYIIAKIHNLGVSLGDCKPENFIVKKDEIFLLDLEQGTRNGNPTWDVAEFLYYSGHYSPPMSSIDAVNDLTITFIRSYLDAGGKKEVIKRAASAKYTKVFSIFTPPHIILAISNLCKDLEK